jgi:peptide subunit release factor 1 (eRF1)
LQHAKEVAEELARIVRKDRIDRIVLAGDETVIIPLLRRHLVEEVDRCVLGVLPLNVHTPEHELFKRCESAVREFRENENRGRVEYLLEHNYTNGAGVAGVESTLRALLNGEVQELFISSDPASVNYNSKDIEQVFLDYGKVAKIPDLSDHTALIDEVLKYGVGSVERIRFVPNLDELKKVDGIGAILRFKASGATQ